MLTILPKAYGLSETGHEARIWSQNMEPGYGHKSNFKHIRFAAYRLSQTLTLRAKVSDIAKSIVRWRLKLQSWQDWYWHIL